MLKLMRLLTVVCLFFGLGTMTYAASPNPVSSAYVQSYFYNNRGSILSGCLSAAYFPGI